MRHVEQQAIGVRRGGKAVVLGTLAALTIAGCSSGGGDAASGTAVTSGGAQYPVTIENCGRTVEFTEPPSRVVILNGRSVAESASMVMLELQDAVLANAQSYAASDVPGLTEQIDALPDPDVTLNQNADIPAEALIALQPDLVIANSSAGFSTDGGYANRDELGELGINTLVNPVNCAVGNPDATDDEKAAAAAVGVESSYEFIELLGEVFGVEAKATDVVDELQATANSAKNAVADAQPVSGIVAVPGMSMMNDNGLPAVMTGGVVDDVLEYAGVTNVFAGASRSLTSTLSPEQLASANVELLVLGAFAADEDLDAAAEAFFAQYPNWPASQTKSYVTVADGVYFGPMNAAAIDKIARAAHPDAF